MKEIMVARRPRNYRACELLVAWPYSGSKKGCRWCIGAPEGWTLYNHAVSIRIFSNHYIPQTTLPLKPECETIVYRMRVCA